MNTLFYCLVTMSTEVLELNKKGVTAAMRGSMQEAEQFFISAASLDPEFSEAAFNLLKLLHMNCRYHEAIKIFNLFAKNKNLRLFPVAISAIIGECAANDTDISAACECCDVLYRHSPIQTELACRYSSILINSGQLQKARSILVEASRSCSNDPSLLTQLAITESELGNYQRAEAIHQKLIKDYGFHFLSNYNYALFLSMLGRDDEALQLLNICLDIVPDAPEAISEIQRVSQKSNSILSSVYLGVECCNWLLVKKLLVDNKKKIDPTYYWSILSDLPFNIASTIEDVDSLLPSPQFKTHHLYSSSHERDIYLSRLEKYIKKQESLIWDRAGKPTRHGMQSHELILGVNNEDILDLTNRLNPLISEFLKSNPLLIKMSQSTNFQHKLSGWGVVLSKAGYQKRHIHPEAVVSGVIYIKLSSKCIDKSLSEGNLLLHSYQDDVMITPEEGLVVIFPSYLGHETIPLTSDHERICIAFNYF